MDGYAQGTPRRHRSFGPGLRSCCAALGQYRSTQRKVPAGRDDEQHLSSDIIELVRQYGRYGYCKIAALLRRGDLFDREGEVAVRRDRSRCVSSLSGITQFYSHRLAR